MTKQLEEEFGPDRRIEIETDDEENEAETDCHYDHEDDDDDDSESDVTRHHSLDHDLDRDVNSSTLWPQSYRRSMDMYTSVTPPSISFLKSPSFRGDRRSPRENSFSLFKPLIVSSSDHDLETETLLPINTTTHTTSESIPLLEQLSHHTKCSYTQSVLNAINALCGIGILSTPYALKEGGWFSLVILLMFGTITCYTGILLKRCLDSSSQLQTYPDIGQAAFGLIGRMCIAAILYVELYSSCVEYLIMMSDSLAAFFPNLQIEVFGIHLNAYQIFAIVSTLVILPTVWLRNLSLLSYVSVGGVVTLALVVICLVWVGATTDIGFHPSGKALNLSNLPITIGIYSFCYGSHSVFPNIYSSMEEPSRFPSVLFISFIMAGLLYSGIAICGFLMFGEATNSQFTLNLPANLTASSIAGWAVVATPVTKFGLSITPVALAIEELLPKEQLSSHGMSILIRSGLVVSTLIVALTVPYFGSVMALIGSLLVMLVSVVLPCACYMRIDKGKVTKLEIATCSSIIVVGLVSAGVGTYSAVTSMSG